MNGSFLDDNTKISALDKQEMLKELDSFPGQCAEACRLGLDQEIPDRYSRVNKILICGLGGSAIVGDLLKDYLITESKFPLIVNRDSHLPGFVDEQTLVILISYSGNTKETLHSLSDAVNKKACIAAVTSGGLLQKRAEKNNIPYVLVPGRRLPRASLGFMFFPVLNMLQKLKCISDKRKQVEEAVNLVKTLSRRWSSKIPVRRNEAKQLALALEGKIPILYGTNSHAEGIVRRWKSQLNENTKLFAGYNTFPEITHNEIECWKNVPDFIKLCKVVFFHEKLTYPEDKKRVLLSEKIISQIVGPVQHVYGEGKEKLARLFSLVYLGDFVSVYLALLYATDPTPMPNIDFIKKHL